MASEIDNLREKLNELRKLRDNATMEKGLAAEENKDLRENFANGISYVQYYLEVSWH